MSEPVAALETATDAAATDAIAPTPTANDGDRRVRSVRTRRRSSIPRRASAHVERRNIIIGLMLAILLGGLDQTIVAMALPRMAADLTASR